jgi:hypothetical protein
MPKQELPVNFKDDILASSMAGKRKYLITQNEDASYSLEDVTDYTQSGSNLGAKQINEICQAINDSADKSRIIDNLDDIVANKTPGMIAGAQAVAALNAYLSELSDKHKSQNKFAASEIDTGEIWVDGKKIYRRTYITTDPVSPSNTLTILLSLTGIADTLWIDQQNSFIRSKGGEQVYPLPLPHYSGSNNYVGVWVNSAGIRLFSDSSWNQNWEKCITIKYTKK